jgi:hypothetical protein
MNRICLCIVIAACGAPAAKPATPKPIASTGTPTTPTTTEAPGCSNRSDEFGPYQLTREQAAHRTGAGATQAKSVTTTKELPVEVCGVGGENNYLASLACADGSHAYKGPGDVERSRRGNVGPGGRCHTIIDLYDVPCPEQTYEIYLDMYQCGPGEDFH